MIQKTGIIKKDGKEQIVLLLQIFPIAEEVVCLVQTQDGQLLEVGAQYFRFVPPLPFI